MGLSSSDDDDTVAGQTTSNDAMNQKWLAFDSQPASDAVNGNLTDLSHTLEEAGNVPRMDLIKFDCYRKRLTLSLILFLFRRLVGSGPGTGCCSVKGSNLQSN